MEKEPINKPFTDLPAFVKAHKIHLKEFMETDAPTNIKDDTYLLADAMQGVKTVQKSKEKIMKRRDFRHFRQTPEDNNPQKLLEDAIRGDHQLNVANLPEFMEGFVEGINPITMEKLRRGEWAIYEAMD